MPRELVALRRSLESVPKLKSIIESAGDTELSPGSIEGLEPCREVVELIASALVDEPPPAPARAGSSGRASPRSWTSCGTPSGNARQYLANLEAKERERTGIKSLKVGYNNVFGYYIEVSNANLAQVPPDYIRKQTLVNGERYFTPELKEYESLILNARDRMAEMEAELFRQVVPAGGGLQRAGAGAGGGAGQPGRFRRPGRGGRALQLRPARPG